MTAAARARPQRPASSRARATCRVESLARQDAEARAGRAAGAKQTWPSCARRLDRLHPADVAYILEALPLEERLVVWDLVKADRDGEILLEVSDAVRESLIASMDERELVAAAETLDADEIADLAPTCRRAVIQDVVESLSAEEREQLRAALSYPEGTVGALMDFDTSTVREDVTLEVVLRYLRRFDELPDHTDQLFVVDRDADAEGHAAARAPDRDRPRARGARRCMVRRERQASTREDRARGRGAARSSATTWSRRRWSTTQRQAGRPRDGQRGGRLHPRAQRRVAARRGGLREEEDLFASVLDSVKNRWAWLAVNLVTAFIASRVIGAFEDSIAQLVALAALMPIVAGIGGNSGNQTITMIVRALALGQIQRRLLAQAARQGDRRRAAERRGLGHAARRVRLPHLRQRGARRRDGARHDAQPAARRADGRRASRWLRARFGRDPAVGSSVLITAVTDSGGFFIFLGLATLFLV